MAAAGRALLVGVDLSEASLAAFDYVLHELARPGDQVHVVHVAAVKFPVTVISHSAPQTNFDVPDPQGELDPAAMQAAVEAYLQTRFIARAEAAQVQAVMHVLQETDTVAASGVCDFILRVTSEQRAALIVISNHPDKGLWSKLATGSVADNLIFRARVPVLVVHEYAGPGSLNKQQQQRQQQQ